MPTETDCHGFPTSFVANSERPGRRYLRREDCFATRMELSPERDLRTIYILPAEGITVAEGHPRPGDDVVAVYGFSRDEVPAVPTGRVFIRFEAGSSPEVEGSGYRILEILEHVPNAAWVAAEDGSEKSALADLDRLSALPGVVSVEPQMLRPVARRGRLRPPGPPR